MSDTDALGDFLADMEYPATKDDLMREGIRWNLQWSDLERLESLQDHSYHGSWHVVTELVVDADRAPAHRVIEA